ncbi:conserved hypothetical protein [Rhodopseudomonas palustris HaA2]|uniref:Uncharacterized protein n=1 Tax=Rhodopseudomonas palustris (strain HaA2) TaxID=316058 RepID=Q2IV40_RHOP2|nr:hypothetical protein [Rhodopseudomonas palustris]ABD07920.1 conserved hypothetical protein [Rhodopseudomonas palustris HaA2]
MRIGSSISYQSDLTAVQLLARAGAAGRAASGSAAPGPVGTGAGGAAASTLLTYSSAGTLPSGASAIAMIKTMAASGTFANAAMGVADDQVRALVRDGKIAQLPLPKDFQTAGLSTAEQNVYHVVQTLQSLYDAQPKTLDDALAGHVATVLDSYPEAIARMKDGLANGTLPESDGWNDVIARYEDELSAAQQGKMKITAIDDPGLVRTTNEFSVSSNGIGWSGRGTSTTANIPALQELLGTGNVLPGGSPYTGSYAISW